MKFNLNYFPERRGFGTRKGTPDVIVWIEASANNAGYRFPVLVELENDLANAITDFLKFSERAQQNNDFLDFFLLSPKSFEPQLPFRMKVKFSIIETSYESVGIPINGDEGDLFRSVSDWCNYQKKYKVLLKRGTHATDMWAASWFTFDLPIFGLKRNICIPLIQLNSAKSWENSLIYELSSLEILCIVVSKFCRWNKLNRMLPLPIRFFSRPISSNSKLPTSLEP